MTVQGHRRESPQKKGSQKKRKTIAEMEHPSALPNAKKHKSMDSDEDDEEPQNEPGSSSNSQLIVPVLPLHQGPAASYKSQQPVRKDQLPLTTLRMKTVSTVINIVHEVRTP